VSIGLLHGNVAVGGALRWGGAWTASKLRGADSAARSMSRRCWTCGDMTRTTQSLIKWHRGRGRVDVEHDEGGHSSAGMRRRVVLTSSASMRWNGEGPGSHGAVVRPRGEGARWRTVMERLWPAMTDSSGRSCGHGWLGFTT
jgi:hypothetical protein